MHMRMRKQAWQSCRCPVCEAPKLMLPAGSVVDEELSEEEKEMVLEELEDDFQVCTKRPGGHCE